MSSATQAAEALQSGELTTWETQNGYFLPPHQHQRKADLAGGNHYDQRDWYGSHSSNQLPQHQQQDGTGEDMDMEDGQQPDGHGAQLLRSPSAGRFSCMSL